MEENKDLIIAVAGTGYVGLSIATLLSQNHKVYAVDIISEKVDLINNRKSPCLLYTSPSPRDRTRSRMPSSA